MIWTPRVTVAAVIRRAEHYLMVEERGDRGESVFNQPAGHLEADESLVEAVCREVLEETGRDFRPTGLIGIYRWPQPGRDRTYLRLCFCGLVEEPRPGQALDPEILATHWLSRAELLAEPGRLRSPLVMRCIDDAEHLEPTPLELLHDVR